MKLRRRLGILCAGMLLGLLGIFLLRGPLTQAAITSGLRRVGAGDITMEVARSNPWAVHLENLAFRIKTQVFSAKRVTMERANWWQPTLGVVRIEGAQVPVTVDGSDTNPFAWASYPADATGTAGKGEAGAGGTVPIPVEKLTFDGRLVVKTATEEQPIEVTFDAAWEKTGRWNGRLRATGPGLLFTGEGSYQLGGRLSFRSTKITLGLKPWQNALQRMIFLPNGPWTFDGALTGEISGSYVDSNFQLGGRFHLANGQLQNTGLNLTADGVEADFEFTDLRQFQSNPGIVRIRELKAGKLSAGNLAAELAFVNTEDLAVHRLTLDILGGQMSAEPFTLHPGQGELSAVVVAENLDVEQIMALSKDVPAKASGRVDGRLPVRLDASGLRLGTGWLQLRKGVYAELQLQAAGLITGGMDPKSTSYQLMKRVESGLLRLKLGALRLEVRPPDAQRGQTARVHLEGAPVDTSVNAPVILDLNVNGPLEQLLNFGLQQNFSTGTGR